MFRIGLSGTNWTGKTETISRLAQAHSELSIKTISLSFLVERCPFPMMENQTVEGSRWMIEQVKTTCTNNNEGTELFDRTPLDILAFTMYALNRTGENSRAVLDDCLELIRNFDRVFYLPVSKEWPTAVSPSRSHIHFARKIDLYIRRAIEEFSLDVTPLPWGLDERQEILSECLASVAHVSKG